MVLYSQRSIETAQRSKLGDLTFIFAVLGDEGDNFYIIDSGEVDVNILVVCLHNFEHSHKAFRSMDCYISTMFRTLVVLVTSQRHDTSIFSKLRYFLGWSGGNRKLTLSYSKENLALPSLCWLLWLFGR